MPMPLAGEWISHVFVLGLVDQHAVVRLAVGLGVGGPVLPVAAEGELHALQQQRVGRNGGAAEAEAVGTAEQHAAMLVAAPPELGVILVALRSSSSG